MQSYQRFQCIGHTVFNTSGTNAPRSLSWVKASTHSAFGEKLHTAAHRAKQGVSVGGGITTLGVLCVLSKRRTSACQSGSFVVFCGRTAIIDSSGVKFDPTHNLENLKTILIFSIACGMVVLLEIKPLHGSYYVGKL